MLEDPRGATGMSCTRSLAMQPSSSHTWPSLEGTRIARQVGSKTIKTVNSAAFLQFFPLVLVLTEFGAFFEARQRVLMVPAAVLEDTRSVF